jgi:hypothetical protein
MRNFIDIDYAHSRAIVREIGERLGTSLRPEPELPASLKMQIDRLRKLESSHRPSFPIWSIENEPDVEPQMDRRNRGEQCHW